MLRRSNPEIAIAHPFQPPPYGGSNQFLLALRGELRRRGFAVGSRRIGSRTRACLLNAFLFDVERVRRSKHPGCRIVHRVDGPIMRHRGTDDGTDGVIADLNHELADVTVFQSRYSLEGYRDLGIELRNPTVIPNAVDPLVFYQGSRKPLSNERVRLISTSWSDNPNKGGETYRWLDRHLDWGRFEYTFVGRTPLEFENIRTIGPVGSHELAELLREHDIYVTASKNDSCSNSLLEALACGLPALYVMSGGHPELVGRAGIHFSEAEEIPEALERLLDEYSRLREAISVPSLPDVGDRYLDAMNLPSQA